MTVGASRGPIRTTADGVAVDVLVSPRSSRPRFGPVHGDRIKLAVTAPPVDGEANLAVVELIAKTLGVGRAAVEVVAGHSSRRKTVVVRGIDLARVSAAVVP